MEMKTSTQFSLVIFAPVLFGLLLPAGFLLPAAALMILLAVLDPTVSFSEAASNGLWAVGPALAALSLSLAGRGLYAVYRQARPAWAAWIAIWIVFTAALFLTSWFGITVISSIGASDKPVAIFLSWTALMAAGLTLLVQPLVILWLYAASRAMRYLKTPATHGDAFI